MRLPRIYGALCALVIASSTIVVRAEGFAPLVFPSQEARQEAADDASAVQKDDSQLWVVERPNTGAPIVDVANRKKKQQPSFWSRMMHPTQWFGKKK